MDWAWLLNWLQASRMPYEYPCKSHKNNFEHVILNYFRTIRNCQLQFMLQNEFLTIYKLTLY